MPLSQNGSDLLKFKKDISFFIETGSADGDGIQSALNAGFEKIYSIELSSSLYDKVVSRFSDQKNVNLINGSSETELPKVLSTVNEPFLLWLDAHASGGQYIGELMHNYLPKEISAILNYSSLFENSVIMIDDMNYYYEDKEFISKIEKLVNELKPNGKISYYRPNLSQHDTLILVSE